MRTDEKPDLVVAVVRLCTAAGAKVNGGGGAAGLIESVAVAEIAGGEPRDRGSRATRVAGPGGAGTGARTRRCSKSGLRATSRNSEGPV
jgi:hypothetical protein